LCQGLALNGHLVSIARSQDRARGEVVHRHALAAELACQTEGPIELRGLGPGIDKHRRVWPLLLHTADCHDPAPTAFGHRGHQRLQQFHRGAQVDGDLAVEVFAGNGTEVLRQFDGGVQHQDVDRRPRRDGGGQMSAGVVPGEILAERGSVSAHCLDFPDDVGGIAEFFVRAGVMNGQACPRAGKTQGDRAPDFAAGAGNQGGAASQAERGEGIEHVGTPSARSGGQHLAVSNGEGKS
jgi:hypothetical protein